MRGGHVRGAGGGAPLPGPGRAGLNGAQSSLCGCRGRLDGPRGAASTTGPGRFVPVNILAPACVVGISECRAAGPACGRTQWLTSQVCGAEGPHAPGVFALEHTYQMQLFSQYRLHTYSPKRIDKTNKTNKFVFIIILKNLGTNSAD